MQALSAAGQQVIQDIAYRHGFSIDAVTHMLDTLVQGNASMAQFNHPEFGGSGQWMAGGMTMLSDMFNNALKFRVDNLCGELSRLIANQPGLMTGSFQSQNQGAGLAQTQTSQASWVNPGSAAGASLFVPPGPDWWGAELRWPNSTGSQNGVRYAYFAQARRLALEVQGHVTIYDTLDHQIGGFSQQQSSGGSLSFNSQYGLIDVASLPVVSVDGAAPALPPSAAPVWNAPVPPTAPSSGNGGDVFALLERLADLRAKGVLTEDEYSSKKAELLARV